MQQKFNKNFKLDFIGIGTNRSATGWIYQCLKEHPQICMSSQKEPRFFSKNHILGFKFLKNCFKHCQSEQIKGEYSPGYISQPDAPRLIKQHSPNAKLILCMRDPIERLYSSFKLARLRGKTKYKTVEEKIRKEPGYFHTLKTKEKGLYFTHLQNWFKYFPKERFLFLIYEDIEKGPLDFIQKIYRFLEVDGSFAPPSLKQKIMQTKNISYRFLFINRFFFKTRSFLQANRFFKRFIPLFRKLKLGRLVNKISHLNQRKKNPKSIKIPPLKPETKAILQKIFQPEIEQLARFLHRDLSFWN